MSVNHPFEADPGECPRLECADVRSLVIKGLVMRELVPTSRNRRMALDKRKTGGTYAEDL
jgi:hypothetical protein